MAQADAERGERIRWLRDEKLHLTQEAMADKVGLTLRGYQEWEAGGGIKWDNVKRLAKVAGVDPEWIMRGERPETPSVGETQLDRIEAGVLRILDALGARQIQEAIEAAGLADQRKRAGGSRSQAAKQTRSRQAS